MADDRSIWPHLAGLSDIIRCADYQIARSDLPTLIGRLIRADNDRVVRLEMRSEEEVNGGGFDGEVFAQVATPFVPEGFSIWEVGTSKDPADKAQKDYKKGTDSPGDVDIANTAFVFVTPRHWPGKNDWAKKKMDDPKWKT